MAIDGINNTQRVEGTTERKLYAKVVDGVMNSRTYYSRLLGKAKKFPSGKSMDITMKIDSSERFQYVTALENIDFAATDNTITTVYRHTAGVQPNVSIMLESFANEGAAGTIDVDDFNYEDAAQEAVQELGSVAYTGLGASSQPLGLEAIVDDGTNVATIGRQTRSSYDALDAGAVTASGGALTLAKLDTLNDACSNAGISSSEPNINNTTKAVWSLYGQLINPQLRSNYNILPVRGDESMSRGDMQGKVGFTSLEYRGRSVIKDDACTSGYWYALNESSFAWHGRTVVPSKYKGKINKVNLGSASATEGVGADTMPSSYNGWFYKPLEMMPDQLGMAGFFVIIGQMIPKSFRHNGKLTGITGV